MSKAFRDRLFEQFAERCAYCRSPIGYFVGTGQIDHIVPRSSGGTSEYENLCLCCPWCNNRKSDQVLVRDPISTRRVQMFNPQKDVWNDHFLWDKSKTRLIGKTARGRATIDALHLNNKEFVRCRKYWVLAGWHPPIE